MEGKPIYIQEKSEKPGKTASKQLNHYIVYKYDLIIASETSKSPIGEIFLKLTEKRKTEKNDHKHGKTGIDHPMEQA